MCGEKVFRNDVFRFEYENRNGNISKKKGHKQCVEDWYRNYCEFENLSKTLCNVLDIPILTKNMITRIRELGNPYGYRLLRDVILDKRHVLSKHYPDKGWNYCFAIIENEVARAYALEQQKKQQLERVKQAQNNVPVKTVDYQKQDSRDISQFLD